MVTANGTREALWPWWHFAYYTAPAAFVGVEAAVLVARLLGRKPAWPWAWIIAAPGCAYWLMRWGDAVVGIVPHLNSYDRQYFLGNTVWLWLLEPVCVLLLVLSAADLRTRRRMRVA
jgi:hypothetical protein